MMTGTEKGTGTRNLRQGQEPGPIVSYSSFSQLHKIGNVGIIANFVFPYICSFLLYLHQLILINWKLEIKEHMRIIFQGCMLYWTS